MLDVDSDGEGRAERGVVLRYHGIEAQALGLFQRQGGADDAAAMADDEGHLLGGEMTRGDDQVAFVLAVVVVDHHHDLATGKGLDGGLNLLMGHDSLLEGVSNRGKAQKIIGSDAATGCFGNARGGLAGNPRRLVIAQGGDARRRQRHRLGEGTAGGGGLFEPGVEFHGAKVGTKNFNFNRNVE